jgi:hypothetical protein
MVRCAGKATQATTALSTIAMDPQLLPMECLICQEQFHEDGDMAPYVLICGHSFCGADIKKLNENGTKSFSCPICQRLVSLDYYESRFPPKNFGLIEQLKHLTEQSGASSSASSGTGAESEAAPGAALGLCAECNDNKASVFCQACQADLCDHCNELLHRSRVLSTHQRLPIENKPPPQPTLRMCPLHPDEKLKLFCDEEQCRTAICLMCSVYGTHKGHRSERLEVMVAAEKDRLCVALETCVREMSKLQSLSESQSELVTALLGQEERFLEELRRDVESCVEAVRAKEAEISQALRAKVAALVRGIGADLAAVTDTRLRRRRRGRVRRARRLCVRLGR